MAGNRANDRSCVLRVSAGNHHVLLPGDIERAAEQRLLVELGSALQADVLIVPHHGSITSSSPGFLNRVNPGLALVSNGYLNRYRHPSPVVMSRYRSRGIEVMETANHGAISFILDQSGISVVRSRRADQARIWR